MFFFFFNSHRLRAGKFRASILLSSGPFIIQVSVLHRSGEFPGPQFVFPMACLLSRFLASAVLNLNWVHQENVYFLDGFLDFSVKAVVHWPEQQQHGKLKPCEPLMK